jgi:hypothetical protein
MYVEFGSLRQQVANVEQSLHRLEEGRRKGWGQVSGVIGGLSVLAVAMIGSAWNLTVTVNQEQRDIQEIKDSIILAKKSTDDAIAFAKKQEEDYAKGLVNDLRYETQRRLPK